MKRTLIFTFFLAFLSGACVQEAYQAPQRPEKQDPEPPGPSGESVTLSLEAVIEGASSFTRSAVAADGRITWTEGDVIGVWTSSSRWVQFGLNSKAGLARGFFKGELDKDETPSGIAVHPFGQDVSLEGTVLTLSLPEVSEGQIPMAGSSAEGDALDFRVLSGAVYLAIADIPAEAQAVVLEADNPICGMYTADISDAVPVLSLKEAGGNAVSAAVPEGAHEFVFPVPEGRYRLSYYFTDGSAEIQDTREDLGVQDVGRGKLLVFESGNIHYTDLFVTPEGSGRHKGYSWENSLSMADLEGIFTGVATASVIEKYAGVSFHFAGGTYSPVKALNFDFTNSSAPVEFNWLGGYNPESLGSDISQRNPVLYPSIFQGSTSENGRLARFDLRSHITLDGFAFNDFVSGASLFYLWTGATNKDIDVTFRDCSFSGNVTDATTNGVKYGGVFFVRGGKLRVESCSFTSNSAERGGDITCIGPGVVYVSGTAENPTVFNGATAETGGSVYLENLTAESSFTNSVFSNNTATKAGNTWAAGGAVSLMRNSEDGTMPVSFIDCSFNANTAPAACGGAIGLYNAKPKTLRLTRCTFDSNSALSRGGAFYTDSGADGTDTYYLTDCRFSANSVSGTESGQGYGGAFDLQGNFKGTMYLDRCTFEGNSASVSGGAWCNYNGGMVCRTFFNACKFKGNTTLSGAENSGVMHICTGYVGLHNCAIYGNDVNKVDLKITGAAAVLLSGTTFVTSGNGNNANPVCNQSGTSPRVNLVNCILKTPGYAVNTRKKGNDASTYAAGSNIDHSVVIGLASSFYNNYKTDCALYAHSDAWDANFTDGGQKTYRYSGTMADFTGFTPMTESTQSYITALGTQDDLDFAAWISGQGTWNRDIDGTLRSGDRTPGCFQIASGAAPALKVSLYGDSISTFAGYLSGSPVRTYFPKGDVDEVSETWWHQLIYQKMPNAVLEGNYSFSGSQVARCTDNTYQNSAWYGNGYVERYLRDGCGQPDLVLIFGGTNDYTHHSAPLYPDGPVIHPQSGSDAPAPSQAVLDAVFDAADAAVTRTDISVLQDQDFCSAYVKLIRLIRYDHPEASIACIIGDILNEPVAQCIRAAGAHYNLPVVDFFATAGYNDTANIPKIDGVHPNTVGMSYIATKVYNEIKSTIE